MYGFFSGCEACCRRRNIHKT